MKRLAFLSVFFCFLIAFSVSAAEEIKYLTPEEFVIIPWGHIPDDLEVLRTIRECGFNMAGLASDKTLDLVHEAGLKALLFNPDFHAHHDTLTLGKEEIQKRADAAAAVAPGHPALYGYFLRDEPGADDYPALALWREAFSRADPDTPVYINLFPNYASPDQMNVPTYEAYVENFITTVKPEILSYDHYALMEGGVLRDGYFSNLESIRTAALRHDLPFWNIVLSNAHFNYMEPTPAGFRFQLYTTLAYGAKGICYFTYFTPTTGNYRLGPIDQFGDKTPTWDMLRNVNLQLHRIGPVYITLQSKNVFHHPNVPDGCSGMETSLYLSKLEGGDLMAGEFENPEGQPFVLVVNKSLHHSCTVQAAFKEGSNILCVNASTGLIHPWRGEHRWLAPGQGMLMTVSRLEE